MAHTLVRALAAGAMSIGMALAVGLGVEAQSRETLETEVTADGDVILLKWTKKHTWDAELQAAAPVLLAEYRGPNGAVGADCLRAGAAAPPVSAVRGGFQRGLASACGAVGVVPGKPDDRVVRYRLPELLTSAPAGPVCLYFQLPNQRILPLRLSNQRGDRTSRFRHEDWEREVARQTSARDAQGSIATLERNVAVLTANVERLRANNAQRRWASTAACAAIPPPAIEAVGANERPLAAPAERDAVARQVCVMQVSYADKLLEDNKIKDMDRLTTRLLLPPGELQEMLDSLEASGQQLTPLFRQRKTEVAAYLRDWQRWAPQVRAYRASLQAQGKRPHFGEYDSELKLQSLTAAVGDRIAKGTRSGGVEAADLLGFVGGSVEAYNRCLADGHAQMETAYRSDTQLRQQEPVLLKRAHDQLIQACVNGVTTLSQEQAKLVEEQGRVAQAEQALRAATATPFGPIPRRNKELNAVACAP